MKFLRNILDSQHKNFTGEGKLSKLYALYEAVDTFAFTPGSVTKGNTHLRDGLDLKRLMVTVAVALAPCLLLAFFNTGYQANNVLYAQGVNTLDTWRGVILSGLGLSLDPQNFISNMVHGALYFIPIFLVTNIVGGLIEGIFSVVRNHEINEGFLVTGLLFPLTLPPTIPLWQVALGIAFGVVFAKEVYGGTGKNFLNVALTARAFLYFAYPAEISGDAVWTAVDGYTGATTLGIVPLAGMSGVEVSWLQSFIGLIPGSMGETSALAALLGAGLLILTGIGSWRIMLGSVLGLVGTATALNLIGSDTNLMFEMPAYWHLVVGGFAFGTVFMATDPVTAPTTFIAQFGYGLLIGFMTILIRVINPAFPEGIMLAILFANVFAPLMDWFVVEQNLKKRNTRYAR
ncbi:MAG: NADH:ubiquinone reductase (Na(+)-transporting) subunit B [Halobacteriovoraceae bacterium]|nr:NADH:ubiquinone reductase (Na(+)-transporting) subunit B [Halobacteriovoraceae bacterium]|tara:strand:+ start:281 stop:1486 length:1206 start_codon:yes stop_codon:yes gene_type:complete